MEGSRWLSSSLLFGAPQKSDCQRHTGCYKNILRGKVSATVENTENKMVPCPAAAVTHS